MIKIRRNVFETNSSSTHSITIEEYNEPRKKTFQYTKIPHHIDIYIDDTEFNEDGDNLTEWQKLNALIDFIAGYYDDDDLDTNQPLFKIVKNVIKDKCDSNLELNLPKYYDYIFDDYEENSLGLLGLGDDSTEDEIYNRFKEIIFNQKINQKQQISYIKA